MSRAKEILGFVVDVWFFIGMPAIAFVVSFANTEKATHILAWCILYHVVMERKP